MTNVKAMDAKGQSALRYERFSISLPLFDERVVYCPCLRSGYIGTHLLEAII